MTVIGFKDLNELFITTLLVDNDDPTTQTRMELNKVGIRTDKVFRHLHEVPYSRTT